MEIDFQELDQYIEDEDWDSVLYWAIEHHDTTDQDVADRVMEAYELCIEQDMPVAYLNLGTFYYNGVFVEQDFKKAYELYKVAADAGELRAICNCGYCFYYGRHQTVDYKEAFRYFNIGALLYDDVNCLYKLGDMYLNGYYVEKNEKYAVILYNRANEQCEVQQGSAEQCLADVQFRLGKCSLRGIGAKKDPEGANILLSLALAGFYKRRSTDPFVGGLIKSTKRLLAEAQAELDKEIMALCQ